MKTNYQTPQIELIEIEIEGVLCASVNDFTDGGEAF